MPESLLDNVIWSALTTRQSYMAIGGARARRYPADIAPFMALDANAPDAFVEMANLAQPGETLYLLNATPPIPGPWEIEHETSVVQMLYTHPKPTAATDAEAVILGADDVADMLELTAIAFPEFFRPRTIEMGTYAGIRKDGRLVAMAGERLYLDGFREISGICTHPDYRGRGYAQQLTSFMIEGILRQGLTPFLHVGAENYGARRVYEKLGFVERQASPTLRLKRT